MAQYKKPSDVLEGRMHEEFQALLKGKTLPEGTIRDWKGRKYKKVAGKWQPVGKERAKGVEKEPKTKVAGAVPSMQEILKIKSKLSESIYRLRKVVQGPKPTEYQKALYSAQQTLLRSVPKTYTPDESKARWYKSVRQALRHGRS